MTAATLFTPSITPQFDKASIDIDVNHHDKTTDIEQMLYDDVDDRNDDFMDEQADNILADTQSLTESVHFRKLQKKLRRQVSWAIRDFNMIEDGDVVMVCVSGGKDSYTLLDILLLLKRIAPIHFDIVAVNLDQKQPGYPEEVLPAYLNEQGIAHYILEKDTYSIVKSVVPEGKTYCSACSRLRRGSLYGFAKQIGATKIALGHHRDDMLATFFLNLFHGGALKSMPPKLLSDDKQNMLIRPLAYVEEKDIIEYSNLKEFPIIPCNLCGSQTNLQRAIINDMLREWDDAHPQRLASIFKAMQNVAPSQLADRELFDFETLSLDRDDNERLFEGDNIQAGQIESLAEIGLPVSPETQIFNPDFANAEKGSRAPKKIPTINPVI
ncbi:tRNA 2-thiocytidine(32) synthetase TtcA [Psychrobacter cryohalolentis]|uniref:tRNA-cytidine(32) 2-sulfurtransferase n=1 Tax=Psychrobacter cryohalolentis (strain ATCC BAA-1226 / DSM 17306 / VKM B-2378 / K5) TaxID=335284 RepID=TTCA_PSYCK|nr:tRNA 2-thiocytidine(32) synthetase TtcA [Psychrobacter cryohalolentis]Q1QCP2.1 RecName: Full=tRNA-cytidine(32) 2-sulfurtransferase; AltName: Full=Two-thiocytidine biosynthesis protein A; AltName: Full=tRNA 2-thiocytidine biosynthesis protein TtcA [Psychrobacter cryohalolentis K5]ABE74561.1 PP-loop [Psychrobacter cryohalolentis K5]ASE27181.1 tRNA 2-thiocytidine(32) synthetase TtcA [Psychrobacter cryohalolentis]